MLKPEQVDPALAVELLDLATRAWGHGVDPFLAGLDRLEARGVRIARYEQWIGLSHPLIQGGRLVWTPEEGGRWSIEVEGRRIEESADERRSGTNPLRRIEDRGETLDAVASSSRPADATWCVDRLTTAHLTRLRDPAARLDAPLPVPEIGPGAIACGIEYGGPERAVLVFVPASPSGFTTHEVALVHTFAWGMSAVSRGNRWRALAHVLARSYIGPDTGLRVLGGKLRRGDLERRRAVVWFSDVRGFTELSVRETPEQVVALLNRVFEGVERAVGRGGGEILKFIGDAVLAVFPYADEDEARDATLRALSAARAAQMDLPDGVRIGIGLHRGELVYGNIGASDRLDFTVIGPTVNIASRIEGLTGPLGKRVLASAEVAACAPDGVRSIGRHPLKGVPEPVELFELAD